MAISAAAPLFPEIPRLPRWGYIIISQVISVAPPVFFYIMYRAQGPLLPVAAIASALPLLESLRHLADGGSREAQRRPASRIFALIQGGVLAGLVLLIIALVSITSAGSYAAWFFYIANRTGSSTISYYFVLKFLLFSGLAGIAVVRGNISGALSALAFVYLTVFSVMYSLPWLGVLALLALIYTVVQGNQRRRGGWSSSSVSAGLMVTAAGFILALLLMAMGLGQAASMRFRLVPVQISQAFFRILPDFPLAVDIPGFGGFNGTRAIHGRPTLSGATVFTIESRDPGPHYIKTQTFDLYENSSWSSTRWLRARSESDPPISFDTHGFIASRRPPGEREIKIRFQTDFYSSVPYTLQTAAISTSEDLGPSVYTGRDGGYILETPFPGSVDFILREDPGQAAGVDGISEAARDNYSAVYPNIRESVYTLARELQGENPEASITNIQQYFSNNYRYRLQYPSLPSGVDTVSHFLEEGEAGYCVQFASSMAIMLRILGIPSRYVTGYYARIRAGEQRSEVTGLQAHAWVEAWLEDRGWITVEATPPMLSLAGGTLEFYGDANAYGDSLTERQLLSILGVGGESSGHTSGIQPVDTRRNDIQWLGVAAIAGASFAVIVILGILVLIILPADLRIRFYLAILIRISIWKKLMPVVSEGWAAFLDALDQMGVYPRYPDFRSDLFRFLYSSQGKTSTANRLFEREVRRITRLVLLG